MPDEQIRKDVLTLERELALFLEAERYRLRDNDEQRAFLQRLADLKAQVRERRELL